MRLKRFLGLAIAAALLGLIAATPAAGADSAVDYPNRPIRMLVPNAPGSSVDTLGRIFAQALTNVTGQQVVIDNRAGAGGVLGMEIGKNANPDGYTILSASTAAMTIAPHIQKKLPFEPMKDYEFVSLFGITPNVLVVTVGPAEKRQRADRLYEIEERGSQHGLGRSGLPKSSGGGAVDLAREVSIAACAL